MCDVTQWLRVQFQRDTADLDSAGGLARSFSLSLTASRGVRTFLRRLFTFFRIAIPRLSDSELTFNKINFQLDYHMLLFVLRSRKSALSIKNAFSRAELKLRAHAPGWRRCCGNTCTPQLFPSVNNVSTFVARERFRRQLSAVHDDW